MRKFLAILILGSTLGGSAITLNGCTMLKGRTEPMGIKDWVELPIGTIITGVPLPTDEPNKKYNIVVSKPSAMVSLDGLTRMGK